MNSRADKRGERRQFELCIIAEWPGNGQQDWRSSAREHLNPAILYGFHASFG